jgi:hypothetical protein
VFTARYAVSPYIKQIRFVFKGLICTKTVPGVISDRIRDDDMQRIWDVVVKTIKYGNWRITTNLPDTGKNFSQYFIWPWTNTFQEKEQLACVSCSQTLDSQGPARGALPPVLRSIIPAYSGQPSGPAYYPYHAAPPLQSRMTFIPSTSTVVSDGRIIPRLHHSTTHGCLWWVVVQSLKPLKAHR